MTTRAHEWLPGDALVDGRLERVVNETLTFWNENWLGQRSGYKLASVNRGGSEVSPATTSETWRRSHTGVACRWNDSLATSLGLAIVDAKGKKSPLSASDKMLLSELAWTSLSDLADSVGKALRFDVSFVNDPDSSPDYVEWSLRYPDKQMPDLALRTSVSSLVRARKAMIGTKIFSVETSAPLRDACADIRLNVNAVLGDARISWGELQTLEPGDVLVLDRALSDSFPLQSARSGTEVSRLSLSHTGDQLQLIITQT